MSELFDTYAPEFEQFFRVEGMELFYELLPLLAEGRPVSVERLAAELGRPSEEVTEEIRDLPDIEYDEDGRVIGAGLTLEPTRHTFHLEDRTLYTWCAWDTLIYPSVLDRPAEVESTCPATGRTIRLTVSAGGVESVEPPETVMSFPNPDLEQVCDSVRTAFCDQSNFFPSAEVARQWLEGRHEVDILTPDEGFELGRRLHTEWLPKQANEETSSPDEPESVACDMTVLDDMERERHEEIARDLLTSVADVREEPDGYALVLPPDDSTVRKAGAFISRERRCCPFLDFTLEVGREGVPLLLTLSGGEGVKRYLRRSLVAAIDDR